MGKLFLQEVDATVMVADVRDFSPLAQQLGPVDLGLALSRFYEHVASVLEAHHGRLVKFLGDGVLAAFIGGDHRLAALLAIADLLSARPVFLEGNAERKLPLLDYSLGAASGTVLAGELGTEKLHFWDVLGQPVTRAFRLCALGTRRAVSNLVDADTWEHAAAARRPAAIETDAVELGAEKLRLFKLEG